MVSGTWPISDQRGHGAEQVGNGLVAAVDLTVDGADIHGETFPLSPLAVVLELSRSCLLYTSDAADE